MAVEAEAAGLLSNSTVWVWISTFVFAFVAYKKGGPVISQTLDGRTKRIKEELEEAERLRVEAQEMLADYQRKYRDAINTADSIVKNAEDRAKQIEQAAMEKLDADLERREVQLTERIKRAERTAVNEIRAHAADISAASIRSILESEMGKKDKDLIDETIKDLPKKLSA